MYIYYSTEILEKNEFCADLPIYISVVFILLLFIFIISSCINFKLLDRNITGLLCYKKGMKFRQIINKTTINPKILFLIDGSGALLSAFLLGMFLTRFESTFGMPKTALYFLAFFPCIFVIYDLYCYFQTNENWKYFLKAIALANIAYCIISITTIFYHFDTLTILGLIYFLIEFTIVIILASIELKTISNSKLKNA